MSETCESCLFYESLQKYCVNYNPEEYHPTDYLTCGDFTNNSRTSEKTEAEH